ncbi:phosphoribosylglycinamide formyltransferase-1 [Breznakia sp. PF5-3]|uniref:phosphoribosylglycinamide formyltransferase n=1 Tax=unclassified Breznakia TaxID=2623764 RepID=UPI00240694F9|nr:MULTISPECIES: phosphoribosylglycinamide formyltransferase [unclassified Breznakia]MDL2276896.1 phosphoribosylglycinamide formyltransferase [Breznakia sp. OttesenSCG-928-G09]MDF9825612.1 phosphoribosylglycinamide formyltransferase-1 [Breznakia sp. PM6-1]MDF9836445.1 phosphoribosylglycinamide formyltransferase-1 [Breznakia sp. PF5-3]MDF9838353.1 phosphoribosylglycinamide formyltransferase-1 [Breznakia sp. PFB2-8]MDF9860355.1 phosphoribosylglycinamide formyltransferase-1 [Breznakia sp. PH5-24]
MVKVAVFASGSGTNFENLAKAKYTNAKIVLLVVDKEDAYAITRAKKFQIPYVYVNPKAFSSKREYEEQIIKYLEQYEIDFIALAGYMRFIGTSLLTKYPNRIINLHPAYLPAFPGAHSIEEAYEAKVEHSGVTIHYVDEGIDTGTIIHQEKVFLDPKWSLEEFEDAIHTLEYKMFPVVLNKICEEVNHEKSID